MCPPRELVILCRGLKLASLTTTGVLRRLPSRVPSVLPRLSSCRPLPCPLHFASLFSSLFHSFRTARLAMSRRNQLAIPRKSSKQVDGEPCLIITLVEFTFLAYALSLYIPFTSPSFPENAHWSHPSIPIDAQLDLLNI